MAFSKLTTATVALALITIGLIGIAAIGAAETTEFTNETIEFDADENVTVDVDWNDSIDDPDATAEVTFYGEDAYQIDGEDATDDLAGETLDGTVAEFDTVAVGATYDIELDESATTVTVSSADIADDGTVDLSEHTEDAITEDDTILSVTATADTILTDAIDADEGNTTSTEYTDADGLEDETEYRLLVEGDDAAIDDVTIDDGSVGGFFPGSDGTPGFGVGVAIVALVTAGVVARARGDL